MKHSLREAVLTTDDARLLVALEEEGNLVRAARRAGLSRDRANYRLARLRRLRGAAIVTTRRGGHGPGATRLTAAGRRVLALARRPTDLRPNGRADAHLASTRLTGRYSARPSPRLVLSPGPTLHVAFSAREGERVTVAIDPEVVLVARRAFPTSARNRLRGTVVGVARLDRIRRMLTVDVAGLRLRAGVTQDSVRTLGLRRGTRVHLYLKAVAVRQVG